MLFKPISSTYIHISRAQQFCTPLVAVSLTLSPCPFPCGKSIRALRGQKSFSSASRTFSALASVRLRVWQSAGSVGSVGSVGLGLSFVAEMHSKQFVQLSPPSTFCVRVYVVAEWQKFWVRPPLPLSLSLFPRLSLLLFLFCTRIIRALFASVVFFSS